MTIHACAYKLGSTTPQNHHPSWEFGNCEKREELNRFILGSDFASNFGRVHCEEDGTYAYIYIYTHIHLDPGTLIFEVLTHKMGGQTNQNRVHLGSRHRYDMCIYKLCMLLSCISSHPVGTGLFITQVPRIIIILLMSQ